MTDSERRQLEDLSAMKLNIKDINDTKKVKLCPQGLYTQFKFLDPNEQKVVIAKLLVQVCEGVYLGNKLVSWKIFKNFYLSLGYY